MKTLNIALVAFAVASTVATSAFAHTEFRGRDGLQDAYGATAYYVQTITASAVGPVAALSDAENVTILHNVSKDLNR